MPLGLQGGTNVSLFIWRGVVFVGCYTGNHGYFMRWYGFCSGLAEFPHIMGNNHFFGVAPTNTLPAWSPSDIRCTRKVVFVFPGKVNPKP